MKTYASWYQVAFATDLSSTITLVRVGALGLLLLTHSEGKVQAFGSTCPHRGANLALGGVLDGDAIICPFHGFRIKLGSEYGERFCVPEFSTMSAGGLIFVRLGNGPDHGFMARMKALEQSCGVVPGFTMSASVDHAMVIENAYDGAHFRAVHKVRNEPRIDLSEGAGGELIGSGSFRVPRSSWQRGAHPGEDVVVPFIARAYSPGIVVFEMGGNHPYTVITSATPTETGCVIRLSLAVPRGEDGALPDERLCQYLIAQSRKGLEADRVIWESLSPDHPDHWTEHDEGVMGFRRFCLRFPTYQSR
jgi:3-ketosteroid 9alpha-monooxygenase subunit A